MPDNGVTVVPPVMPQATVVLRLSMEQAERLALLCYDKEDSKYAVMDQDHPDHEGRLITHLSAAGINIAEIPVR